MKIWREIIQTNPIGAHKTGELPSKVKKIHPIAFDLTN